MSLRGELTEHWNDLIGKMEPDKPGITMPQQTYEALCAVLAKEYMAAHDPMAAVCVVRGWFDGRPDHQRSAIQ